MRMALRLKRLAAENWLEPDSISASFWEVSLPEGKARRITGDDWVRMIFKPALSDSVPAEVRNLFEVARGAMAYGYFFYPLYTLGLEQLFRVAEAAVTLKCRQMKAPSSADDFEKKVDYLISKGIASGKWHTIRRIRNILTHAERPNILPPGTVLENLNLIAGYINSLFSSP